MNQHQPSRPPARPSLRAGFFRLLFIGLLSLQASAQDPVRDFLRYGDLVYAEAVQLPSEADGKCRLDVTVRIAYDYLVFVKTDRPHRDSLFTAGSTVSFEVTDQNAVTVFSEDEKASLYAPDFATTNTRDAYVLMKQSVQLPPGRYTVHVTINDLYSTRERRIPLHVELRLPAPDSLMVLSAVPVYYRPTFDKPQVAALGFGGRFLFAEPATVAVTAVAPPGTEWVFSFSRMTEDGPMPVWSDTVPPMLRDEKISGSRQNGIVNGFGFDSYSRALSAALHVFQLPLDTCDVGEYELRVTAVHGGRHHSLTVTSGVFWKDMPLTLKNIDLAMDLMRYILDDNAYAAMNRGSDESRRTKLTRHWKERDPSPGTAYNEALVEFFKRADQAYYKFQTMTVTNGALTDRGKIYILYGPPEEIERVLSPGGLPQEVWSYPSLKKTIRFVDRNRNGNLRLAP